MKALSQKQSLAIASLLVAMGSIAGLDTVAAEVSAAQKTLCIMGFATCDEEVHDLSFSSTFTATPEDDASNSNIINENNDYLSSCYIWPPAGAPPEHLDNACNRAGQNALWAAEDAAAQAAPLEDSISDAVYLNMPEEKTWTCPLDIADETAGSDVNYLIEQRAADSETSNSYAGATGHPSRWILHNEATTPIVLAHVNPLGLEVSAMDFGTHPAHANTAVYPNGPIVLPGQTAVVEGRQGQMFVAREYKEMLPMHAMAGNDGDGHSWKSFKSILPSTISFSRLRSRYETKDGVWHVLGNPGQVLMKHRMGNTYINNQFGATCPELLVEDGDDVDKSPNGMDHDCNVLRKTLINKVGCPVDIYFAPQNKIEGYDCELLSSHLGSIDSFLTSERKAGDIYGHNSPLKFENTYNGHSFVARMSHDQSLVARIEFEHDTVKDCPNHERSGGTATGVKVHEGLSNAQVNATTSPVFTGKPPKEKNDILLRTRISPLYASVSIAS